MATRKGQEFRQLAAPESAEERARFYARTLRSCAGGPPLTPFGGAVLAAIGASIAAVALLCR